jgi:hypothetical protein
MDAHLPPAGPDESRSAMILVYGFVAAAVLFILFPVEQGLYVWVESLF